MTVDRFARLYGLIAFEFDAVATGAQPRAEQRAAADRAADRLLRRFHNVADNPSVHPSAEVLARHPTGRPRWPAGIVGSIAHTSTLAVVGVAPNDGLAAVGVDLEVAGALEPADAAYVLSPHEQQLVDTHSSPSWLATALWCAKEAAFKAWCGWADDALDGTDPLDVAIAVQGMRFTAGGVGRLASLPSLDGQWSLSVGDLLLTVALLPVDQSTASAAIPVNTSAASAASPST